MTTVPLLRGLACVGALSVGCMGAVQPNVPTAPLHNLALDAQATASESYGDLTADKARDGDRATRWSGIPGHNEGVWFQLGWPRPVRVGEVAIHQFDRFVMELDVQVWDEHLGDWRTVQHFGAPDRRLPSVVICRFDPVETSRLRIGNITNGPSFTEVEVYADHFAGGTVTRLASDLRGNLIGIVTDAFGASGVPDAEVTLTGRRAHGPPDWRFSVRSDASGLFTAPLPLGLIGPVEVTTSADGTSARVAADACEFQYGLTPRPAGAVAFAGPWRFAPDPPEGFQEPGFDDAGWSRIHVPAHWEMQGFHPVGGVGGYRARFAAPTGGVGGARLKLAFDGVYSGAQVWVNGQRVAVHEGGATPFECDITDATHPGENLLAVRVAEHTLTSDALDQMSSYADFPLGGIIRSVWLVGVPDAHVGSMCLQTDFDPAYQDATLVGRVSVLNESDRPLDAGSLRFRLVAPDGAPVGASQAPVRAGAWEHADVPLAIPVHTPRPWDAEHPNLHTLEVELRDGEAVLQRLSQRVGFRQTDVRGPQLLINGGPVKIRGTCHHDSHPLLGRAVTPELTRQDLSLIKQANLNALRTSHYPPIPELLDIADELGLYVEDEASFCWVGVSDDLTVAPRILQLTAELLARDRNHPSVFMWSLCNESQFGRGFELSRDWVHAADPSRPLGAATSAWLDLATMHNPITIAGIDQQERLDKPLLFDESFAPFQGIWGDATEMWLDPGLRDYFIQPLPAIYDRMMASRATQGSMIWAWSDDIFCVPGRGLEYGRRGTRCHFIEEQYAMPGRGLVGDAPWGLVDGWRRPKPEYWLVKKMHSPVRIHEGPLDLPPPGGTIRIPVENQYDFADLSELQIQWRIGDERGIAAVAGADKPSVPHHTAGEIRIRPGRAPRDGDLLALTLTDSAGMVVNQCELPLGIERVEPPPRGPIGAVPLLIREERTLAGRATRVIGGQFEIALDRDSGRLRRCVGFGEPLLVELPGIHLLQSGQPLADLPSRETWRVQETEVRAEGENVRIRISGKYDRLVGQYDLLVSPSGEITAGASFENTGPEIWVREVGLRIATPRTCDRLEWLCRTDWRAYPDDHIGRPRGATTAFADHAADLPPRWPWSQDNSPLGCNDFRSTKRNINWAALECPAGAGVAVISDGRQHARATVESDRIALHINDWYGGTGAGLGEWEQNYGRGRLVKAGDQISATMRLRLIHAAP